MATPIKENVNSDYLEVGTLLRPKSKPKSVIVYVESEEDIAFWRTILYPYENNEIRFEIRLPSNASLAKGKNKALERSNDVFELVTGELGRFLLICVDSDYDYLLHGHYQTEAKREIARKINESIYIFQTYTYSIENLKCYAESLHSVCVASTFNDEQKIDFVGFMQVYSNIIYELFLWNLLFYSKGEDNNFTLTQFCNLIKVLDNPDINDFGKDALKNVDTRVNNSIKEFEKAFPNYVSQVKYLGENLEKLGLNGENAYLFVQGHTIFDNVVLMLLKPLCTLLKQEKEAQIKQSAKHKQEMISELKHYHNKVGKVDNEITKILSSNTEFQNCFLFSKIKQDIQRYIVELQ